MEKKFIISGDYEFGPVSYAAFEKGQSRLSGRERRGILALEIGESYDFDTCSKCGHGKRERVIWRVQ